MSTSSSNPVEALQNRGPVVLAVTIALLIASTTFVVLRLISRIGVVKRVSWDDHFIVLAWLIAFGFSFSICWGTHVGLGRHEVDIPVQGQQSLKKAEYAFSVLYNPALMSTKTSILIFYLTLAKTQQIFRWATIATLLVVNVAGIALTFLNIFQCHPVSAVFEDPVSSAAICTDIVTLYLSSSPANIVTDLAILFLPMPILTSMRLPRKQKIILIITFSFGAFVAVVDVVRIAYLQAAFQVRLSEVGKQNATESRITEQDDFSWYASLSFMWSAVEVNIGIICACVPSLKPLASRVLPSILRDTNNPSDTSELDGQGNDIQFDETTLQGLPSVPTSPTKTHVGCHGQEGDLDMINFLTMPEMVQPLERSQTALTVITRRSRAASSNFYDFVNMKNRKSMVKLSNKESYFPLALVTILFFMWGFAYGLLSILNAQFQLVVHMSTGQSLGLHAAYYAAYFVGPLTFGQWVLKRWGFKATFITGLCIYGCGTLIFWPSAVLTSFAAFLISNFIVGLGVATLEVAGNPFVALCGPPEHAETRLNISQGVQAIGSVVSPILAQKVFFKSVQDTPSLINVQWAYLGIALFDVLLAAAFYYFPIPEASDEDFEAIAEKRRSINMRKVAGLPVVYITLALGVFSQFCYVGGQEAVAGVFEDYVALVKPNSAISPFDYQAVGHTVFAVGRFLTAFAGFVVKPRWILLFLYFGAIVTAALAMSLDGYAGVSMIVLTLFFESGIFSMIYAMSLRGLGVYTKTGAVFITAATSGGAIFPVVMNPVQNSRGLQYAFCVVVAVFSFGTCFPLYLVTVPAAKQQVDPVQEAYVHELAIEQNRPTSSYRRAAKVISTDVRRKKKFLDLDGPTAEHVE